MTPLRYLAIGTLLGIILVTAIHRLAQADEGRGVYSTERGSGWGSPADSRYPDHGYIYEPGDGTQEHIDIEAGGRRDWSQGYPDPAERYTHPWLREEER